MDRTNMPEVPLLPHFPFQSDFESRVQMLAVEEFVQVNYHHSIYYVVVYLLAIVFGQYYMKSRTAVNLSPFLVIWNWTIAAISLAGALRTVPEIVHSLRYFGLDHTVCDDRYYYVSSVMFFWCQMVLLLKVLELLDTLFVVLRKRKLIFLHWFHHSTVLVFTWVIAKDRCAITRWYISMNFTVHAVMYSYYALRTMKVTLPRSVAVFITSIQILQMVVGLYVSLRGLYIWYSGNECAISRRVALFGSALYTFYFVLFVRFFVNAYVRPRLHKKVH